MLKLPASRTIVLDPALFDATGRAEPKVVELPPAWDPFAEREYQRRRDAADRAREWAADER